MSERRPIMECPKLFLFYISYYYYIHSSFITCLIPSPPLLGDFGGDERNLTSFCKTFLNSFETCVFFKIHGFFNIALSLLRGKNILSAITYFYTDFFLNLRSISDYLKKSNICFPLFITPFHTSI